MNLVKRNLFPLVGVATAAGGLLISLMSSFDLKAILLIVSVIAGWIAWKQERNRFHALQAAESTLRDLKQNTQQITEDYQEKSVRFRETEAHLQQLAEERTQWEERLNSERERLSCQERLLQERTAHADLLQEQLNQQADYANSLQSRLQQSEAERESLCERVAVLSEELAQQVIISLSEVEQAISSAIESFTAIAQEAQSAAELAQSTVGSAEGNRVARIAEEATGVINLFIQGMLLSARKITASSRNLESLVRATHRLTDLLDDIEAVADHTALISLNASIEAARAGNAGRAFNVVAEEIRKLAKRSQQTAERMRQITLEVTGQTTTIYQDLGATAESSLEASCEAQNEVNKMLVLLNEADQETRNVLSALSGKSENITRNYAGIITAFQFHDLLRQRLEHVADPLCALRHQMHGDETARTEEENLAYAVGQTQFSARSVGAAPSLKIVKYEAQEDGDITLF